MEGADGVDKKEGGGGGVLATLVSSFRERELRLKGLCDA